MGCAGFEEGREGPDRRVIEQEKVAFDMKRGFKTDESFALKLDSEDPLAEFRQRFYIPRRIIYMDGSSRASHAKTPRAQFFES